MSKPLLQLEEDFSKLGFVQNATETNTSQMEITDLGYPKYFKRGKELMYLTSFLPEKYETVCFNISHEALSSNLPQRYESLRKTSLEGSIDRWNFFTSFNVKELLGGPEENLYTIGIMVRLKNCDCPGGKKIHEKAIAMDLEFKYDTFEAASLAFKDFVEEIKASLSS